MEYSLFMIKPCAYEKKDEILEIISKKLNVLFTRDINLDEKFLNKLYKSVTEVVLPLVPVIPTNFIFSEGLS